MAASIFRSSWITTLKRQHLDSKKWASLVAQSVKSVPAMKETWVRFLGQEDPLERKISWRRQWLPTPVVGPGGLQSMGWHRVGYY